ncbi:MAG: hypothetical protein ACD_43C00153G0004 [uncultured bacterium]|nr:MAG: hypothetical protein ACD_43C00153G0004 [uncultured bacterium]
MQKIYDTLKTLNIKYEEHDHPAVFTCVDAAKFYDKFPGARVKNLFLRNRKGDRHYLLIVSDNKTVDLKQLAQQFGEKQLSFASAERLMKYLHVTPGSVSALGLVYDTDLAVKILCDDSVQQHEQINLHPNINTKTITLTIADLLRYFGHTGHAVQFLPI